MSYSKVTSVKFSGLQNTISSDLIQDGEARDILNFRQEKIGKLTSRHGSLFGLFTVTDDELEVATGDHIPVNTAQENFDYTINAGIVGIGELVLEDYWPLLRAKRFMVYSIVGQEGATPAPGNNSPNQVNARFQTYLISPLEGVFKNKILNLLTGISQTEYIVKERDALPQGNFENTVDLVAPFRRGLTGVGIIPDVLPNEDTFDRQFVDMHQYRNALVISDHINGDMLLEDEFSRAENQQCDDPTHSLKLRPNELARFDIDIVELDSRLEPDQHNDKKTGVETPMALYKFNLPTRYTQPAQDHFDGGISEPGFYSDLGLGSENWDLAQAHIEKRNGYFPELFTVIQVTQNFGDGAGVTPFALNGEVSAYGCGTAVNDRDDFIFTNTTNRAEFADLLGELSLEVPNTEEIGTDVFIWKDLELSYKPCSGVTDPHTMANPNFYLRDLDRLFDKLDSSVPRITKLKVLQGRERDVELGVWRYRYVWDFGNGIYSAPSAEILSPDLLWSAASNDEVRTEITDTYERPNLIQPSDMPTRWLSDAAMQSEGASTANGTESDLAALFDSSGNLTELGWNVYLVKSRLYKNLDYRFGGQIDVENMTEFDSTATLTEKGNLTVLATVGSESYLDLVGIPMHGVTIKVGGNGGFSQVNGPSATCWANNRWFREYLNPLGGQRTQPFRSGGIVLPMFQTTGDELSYNSVFDEDGKFRLGYLRESELNKQIVVDGYFPGWGNTHYTNTGLSLQRESEYAHAFAEIAFNDVNSINAKLFFNFVPVQDGDISGNFFDKNNKPDTLADSLEGLRPPTLLRGIQNTFDDLLVTSSDIPNEVLDRLVVTGTAELPLINLGDDVGFQCQTTTPVDASSFEGDYDPDSSIVVITRNSRLLHEDDISKPDATSIRDADALRVYDIVNGTNPGSGAAAVIQQYDSLTNIEVKAYLTGSRFIGPEQLTAFFPSSLLFGAPRMAHKIPTNQIPDRAKRVLVYRTRSSHSNDFNPLSYGLVDSVEINRDSNGVPFTDLTDQGGWIDNGGFQQDQYDGWFYFDKIEDDELNFGNNPEQYEGIRDAIRSSFNIALNERVYYLNFSEDTQPEKPRGWEYPGYDDATAPFGTIKDTWYEQFDAIETTDPGFDVGDKVMYKYSVVDSLGLTISEVSITDEVTIIAGDDPAKKKVIVLKYMPANYDFATLKVKVYRAHTTGATINPNVDPFYYIGDVNNVDEGVFLDQNNDANEELSCSTAETYDYPSGIRWSEPYRADWIKVTSFSEYRSGDGKAITGVTNLYGNLVIFKENSVHRVAVQANDPPISRTDEVSREVGCIAPNTLINVNDNAFFLSWRGFMRYNNNTFDKIDGAFDEELQYILNTVDRESLRYASAGYNPATNELYLSVPVPYSNEGAPVYFSKIEDEVTVDYFGHPRVMRGNIYVINLDKQYTTKFSMPTSVIDPLRLPAESDNYFVLKEDGVQSIRKYFTNSLGEMRSAEIYGNLFGPKVTQVQNPIGEPGDMISLISGGYIWAGIFIESPYDNSSITDVGTEPVYTEDSYHEYDDIFDTRKVVDTFTAGVYPLPDTISWDFDAMRFPQRIGNPIKSKYYSKFFTGEDEILIKRVRKAWVNIFSHGRVKITTNSSHGRGDTDPGVDNRIEDEYLTQSFDFNPSITLPSNPINGDTGIVGTQSTRLSVIPENQDMVNPWEFNDWNQKPLRFSVAVEAEYRTQINALEFHWRPINTYID